jgi:DMSO/TMAO reductase YedYZ heme-binding membrane subunit
LLFARIINVEVEVVNKLRGWHLLGVLAIGISVLNVLNLLITDFSSYDAVQQAVVRTMYIALPSLMLALLAGPVARWRRHGLGAWMGANRRYFGLGFSVGMAWHLALVSFFMLRFGNRLEPSDLALDIIGLLFLVALTVTSFMPVRERLGLSDWQQLHRAGIYVLWFLPTYFFVEDYADEARPVYAVSAGLLISAMVLRWLLSGRVRNKRRQVERQMRRDDH